MDVIANIDRTIDGIARRAGDRFELPDDSDLVARGVARSANPSADSLPPADAPAAYFEQPAPGGPDVAAEPAPKPKAPRKR